jgi:D-3-phosphoglycerate dehydrogenase
MRVLYWTPRRKPEAEEREAGLTYVPFDELLRESDFVSLHSPLNAETRHQIGARELRLMKKTAFLVNTARGPIVDEDALLKALQEKKIAGAGLDVFGTEPLPLDHPIRKLDNVVLSPHLGYVTAENYHRYYGGMVEDIKSWLDGKPIRVMSQGNRI